MDAGAIVVSSPLPLSSSVDSGIRNSKKGDENIDTSIFTLNLSEAEHDNVCFHLDKNSRWQDAARKMGYTMGYIKVKIFFNNFFNFYPYILMNLNLTSLSESISNVEY